MTIQFAITSMKIMRLNLDISDIHHEGLEEVYELVAQASDVRFSFEAEDRQTCINSYRRRLAESVYIRKFLNRRVSNALDGDKFAYEDRLI
jgi:hypothetical protein